MKVVHAADLHIDSPLRGLGRHEGLPVEQVRLATRHAFINLVDLCLAQRANVLLLAGDVFDGEWRDFNTGVFFVRQLARLRSSGTEVVMLHGNHDAESPLVHDIPLPSHVRVLGCGAPETVVFKQFGLAVHGQSYAHRVVDDNLAANYPKPLHGLINIGMLHTNANGSADHGNYAPCTVKQLVRHGYHYWALGHVHQRVVLHRNPWVVYPGNLQGRHARETGPKGCMLIELSGQRVVDATFVPLDVLRWHDLAVEVGTDDTSLDLDAKIRKALTGLRIKAGTRAILVRVRVHGVTLLHQTLAAHPEALATRVRAIAADVGDVWPEKVLVQTQAPESQQEGTNRLALAQALRTRLDEIGRDKEALAALCGHLETVAASVAPFVKTRPDRPEFVRELLPQVEALVLGRLDQQLGGAKKHVQASTSPTGQEATRAAPVASAEPRG